MSSETPNTNCLAGIACQHCGYKSRVQTVSRALATLDDEVDESTGLEFDDTSLITCSECKYQGTVVEFREMQVDAYEPNSGVTSVWSPDDGIDFDTIVRESEQLKTYITVSLPSQQWNDIVLLLGLGKRDLEHYSPTHAAQDGYCKAEIDEMERLKQNPVEQLLSTQLSASSSESAWSKMDSAKARSEGWNLFASDGTEFGFTIWSIEREDELCIFADDASALKHIYLQASKGSELHLRALTLHMTLAR
ncbi:MULTISPECIES: hypothetical protein [Halomonas]|uniref:hypothetical protein n=1 Tax=Halomonas TaxID=2745 RepID=UPI001869193B|nr:hypothetical protein [Halomonas citrativorans]